MPRHAFGGILSHPGDADGSLQHLFAQPDASQAHETVKDPSKVQPCDTETCVSASCLTRPESANTPTATTLPLTGEALTGYALHSADIVTDRIASTALPAIMPASEHANPTSLNSTDTDPSLADLMHRIQDAITLLLDLDHSQQIPQGITDLVELVRGMAVDAAPEYTECIAVLIGVYCQALCKKSEASQSGSTMKSNSHRDFGRRTSADLLTKTQKASPSSFPLRAASDAILFDAAQPFPLHDISRCTQVIVDLQDWTQIPDTISDYSQKMMRLLPWYNGEELEAISLLRDVYTALRDEYVELKAREEDAEQVRVEGSLRSSVPSQADDPRGPDRALINKLRSGSSKRPLYEDANSSDGNTKRQRVDRVPFDIDESVRPYYAWALYEDPLQQVKAATKHMLTFPMTRTKFTDEPLLFQAECTALNLIAKGGVDEEEVAGEFLRLYRSLKASQPA